MRIWDTKLITRMIEGGIAQFCNAHPDRAIPRGCWRSISKRISRRIVDEHYKRFGNPVDKLVVQFVARKIARRLQQGLEEAA